MTTDRHDYLWDRSGAPDPFVVRLEQRLGRHRFDPVARPFKPGRRSTGRWAPRLLALAATLILVSSAGFGAYAWRLAWPSNTAWPIDATGGDQQAAALAVGRPHEQAGGRSARARIARIGRMAIAPNTVVTLEETSGTRHVLSLERGEIDVRVFAPPRRVLVRTPAGMVIDMGCAFELAVDERGVTAVRVRSGWVELENGHGSVLVPAGARSTMRLDDAPDVPVFEDAPEEIGRAVRLIVAGADVEDGEFRRARARDAMTLLVLATRVTGEARARVISAAARVSPPPETVDVTAVAAGNDTALWRWFDALPLPPPKHWWRNWRDAL